MDGNIPGEFVDRVRSHYDIVQLVSEYVQLKKSGRNYFGLCPFHGEKTPSFSVSPDKQIFHCFGCGEGGNVFSFLMKADGLSFPEAVKELAKRAGLPLPETTYSSPGARQVQRNKERLLEAVNWAYKYFRYLLEQPAGNHALQYLQQRGLTAGTVQRFGLGYAPDSWDALKKFLLKKQYSERELLEAGLLTENEKRAYDRFRNRVIFPISNQRGEVIAFGGRVLGDESPKYLNSPETPLFDKGKNLFALHLAREEIRREKRAVIFEGYLDVITAHQAGIANAVASLGTSLTDGQARLLRNQAEEVVIVYDADAAGQAATWRGLQILRQAGCLVKVGRLPSGLDPDDFIRRWGGEAFRSEVLEKALLLVDYQLQSLAEQYSPDKHDERIRLFDKVGGILSMVENAMEREDYIAKTAKMLGVPASSVREELSKKRVGTLERAVIRTPIRTAPEESAAEKAPLQLLALWARFPSLLPAAAELEDGDFPPEFSSVLELVKIPGKEFSPAHLLDMLPEGKHRQTLSRMFINDEFEEKVAKKAVDDCVRLLKSVRIARQRKELEAQMASLDPVSSKGEISELSKKWLELRKLEQAINHPGEGGKGVG